MNEIEQLTVKDIQAIYSRRRLSKQETLVLIDSLINDLDYYQSYYNDEKYQTLINCKIYLLEDNCPTNTLLWQCLTKNIMKFDKTISDLHLNYALIGLLETKKEKILKEN